MSDAIETVTQATMDTKVSTVRSGQRNLFPMVMAYRGEQMVAAIEGPTINRDDLLVLAGIAAGGYEADVVATAFETWVAKDMRCNPLTNHPWEPGEMQDAVENHHALEEGWIRDAVMVNAVNRAGDFAARTLAYAVKGRRVQWLTDEVPDHVPKDGQYEGYVVDKMREMMLTPPMMPSAEMNLGQE